jgi:hypothetical protein
MRNLQYLRREYSTLHLNFFVIMHRKRRREQSPPVYVETI